MNCSTIAYEILNAVGGSKNLLDNEVCMTRLRLSVEDFTLIDNEQLSTAAGVLGVVGRGTNGVEVVFGPNLAQEVNNSLNTILEDSELTTCKITDRPNFSTSASTYKEEMGELISLLENKNLKQTTDADQDTNAQSSSSNFDELNFVDEKNFDFTGPRLLIVNGPNINMLGIREPELYGKADYRSLIKACKDEAQKQGFSDCTCYQSNHEGDLIDALQDALGAYDGIIINPAAYTHTSIALLDAALAVRLPIIEVHLTDISSREDFRHISYIREACFASLSGKGIESYREAIQLMAQHLAK